MAAYPLQSSHQTKSYPNNSKGIKKFIGSFTNADCHCVLEATGNYGTLLLYMLSEKDIAVSLANPKQIKHFARMMMTVTKTDHVDAKLIALYGDKMQPPIYKMPTETIVLLKQKKVILRQLKKQLTSLNNLRESFDVLPKVDKGSIRVLDKTAGFIEKQILEVETELSGIAEEVFGEQIKPLTSIKGIGATLATSLIISTGGSINFRTQNSCQDILVFARLINNLVPPSI